MSNIAKSIKAVARKVGGKMRRVKAYRTPMEAGAIRLIAKGAWGHDMGPNDRIVYWDPLGVKVPGGVNLRKDIYESNQKFLETVEENLQKGIPFNDAITMARISLTKSLASTGWNIPVHAVPRVTVVQPGELPIANLIPRVAVGNDQIQTTPVTAIGDAAAFSEGGNYPENDDTYHGGTIADYTFDVKGYGRKNAVTDLMSLVGRNIADPRMTTSELQVTAIRRWEEKQILTGTSTGDSNGFKGVEDLAGTDTDKSGTTLSFPEDLRSLISLGREAGCDLAKSVVITDFTTFDAIRNGISDYNRYAPQNLDLKFGFTALEFDGVKVMPSSMSPTTTKQLVMMDLSKNWMGMVQDATIKPLAKTNSTETFATDAYGCLVSEGRPTILRWYGYSL